VALLGDLRTFPLEDLLLWASRNHRTGVFEVERNAISKRVEFRKGWVGSCTSNEPAALLGQFLLSRGRINETQLQHLLTLRKATRKRLGLLLVELNLLSRSDLAHEIAAKAEETIHSLFDWDEAYFRFDEGATLDPDQIEVNLSVDELIVAGKKRAEELREIRRTFSSSGVVLAGTGAEPPADLLERAATRRILDAVDGQRTIAEVLLHTRLSEFRVLQLLFHLYGRGLLRVVETRPVGPETETLLDARSHPPDVAPRPAGADDEQGTAAAHDPDGEISQALGLVEREEYEAGIELLRTFCRDHTSDYARRLLARAEAAHVERMKQDEEFISRVPVLLRDRRESLAEVARPEDSFLLTLIDGMTDIQCILWLTPLREIDVLTALRRLTDEGVIELRSPLAVAPVPFSAPFAAAT